MRRSSLFLTLCLMLVLSFGLAHGQSAIRITAVSPAYGGDGPDANTLPDTIKTGVANSFTFSYVNQSGGDMTASTNGFVVYSPDGANWSSPVGIDTLSLTGASWTQRFDLVPPTFDMSGSNGSSPDTVGFGGVSNSAPHIENGFNQNVGKISVPAIAASNSGKMLCIDSAKYGPALNEWLWSTTTGGVTPDWTPYCFRIFNVPNEPPVITNCAGFPASFNHCSSATYDFNSSDPDSLGARPLTFVKNSGPGTVNAASGVWTYSPTLADVGAGLSLSVSSQDDPGNAGAACVVALNFTNVAPSFTAGCITTSVGKGNTGTVDMNANSGDCDPISFSILSVTGTPASSPVGSYSINSSTGVITFNTAVADGGSLFTFNVQVTDGKGSSTCQSKFDVLNVEPFEVQIEKTHRTTQGTHEIVSVTLNLGSEQMSGFDFLIAYDNSALSLAGVNEGAVYAQCGWEYFNFRHGANGNCSNSCPTGLVRVVGLAETNNGANHPTCGSPSPLPATLFDLDFLVTNDRNFECQYVPVRFFWVDCGDNAIAYHPSDAPNAFEQALAVSREIHDFDFFAGDISNGNTGFPTYYGAQNSCLDGGGPGKPTPIRFLDLINGGIDIVCVDSIDSRGDINLNGLSNEIADAVLFSNYFVYGMSVFTVNAAGQIAATDVNADGLVLSVADLVYLIRVVIGDATPYNKLAPVAVSYSHNANGVVSIKDEVQIGGAFIVVAGQTTPELKADNMEMVYAYDGANTRVLVWSRQGNSFTGDFLNVNGQIVSIDMATFDGQPVALEVLPTVFALNQNYPNPFNPKTRISFALPTSSDYTLTIYNVTGQKVTEFNGSHEAGNVEIDVDASSYSSGVYFYKLIADNGRFTETKKMVLVK